MRPRRMWAEVVATVSQLLVSMNSVFTGPCFPTFCHRRIQEMRLFHSTIAILICLLSVAVATAQDRAAATPSGTDQSAANVSQAQAAIDRAAAANKYVFLFFWKDKSPQTDKAWGALQPAVAKMADVAVFVSIRDHQSGGEEDRGQVWRKPCPDAAGAGNCPVRRDHQGVHEDIRREGTPHRVRQPLHGTLPEGPPEPQAGLCLRCGPSRPSRSGDRSQGSGGLQGRQEVRRRHGGRAGECARRQGSDISQGTRSRQARPRR